MFEEVQEIRDCMARLDGELDDLRKAGCQYAKNEREYRIALRSLILTERAQNNTPVSIVGDVCRGREDIADMKCMRDCSEALYKAAQEAINVEKLRIRVLNDQLSREWASGRENHV